MEGGGAGLELGPAVPPVVVGVAVDVDEDELRDEVPLVAGELGAGDVTKFAEADRDLWNEGSGRGVWRDRLSAVVDDMMFGRDRCRRSLLLKDVAEGPVSTG